MAGEYCEQVDEMLYQDSTTHALAEVTTYFTEEMNESQTVRQRARLALGTVRK